MALAALVAAGASVAALPPLARYKDGPPPGRTGGFGEPTCGQCHSDAGLNEPGGELVFRDPPRDYQPGRAYTLTVSLRRPGMSRAGFQLAARFAEGGALGTQAGALEPVDRRASVVRDTASGVLYLEHTLLGTTVFGDSARWTFHWTAPARLSGPVVFHVAANAANDDDSPLGDFIYTRALRLAAAPR